MLPRALRQTQLAGMRRCLSSILPARVSPPSLLRPSAAGTALSSPLPASRFRPTPHASFSLRTGPDTPHHSTPPVEPLSSRPDRIYSTREVGKAGTADWRLYVQRSGRDISPWHDIPLLSPSSSRRQLLFHFVCEIPKGTRPKLEVATGEEGNPLKQDSKKGRLRNLTYGDMPFNYGMLPQTWEDPNTSHPLTRLGGDNDPLDVVELSDKPLRLGSVHAVQVIGALALLDEGETDWKLLAIDAEHPLAGSLRHADDVDVHFPGRIDAVREWFRNYKTTDGKGQNDFGAEGKVLDVGQAQAVIWETHGAWSALCRGEIKGIDLAIPAVPNAAATGGEDMDQAPQSHVQDAEVTEVKA